MSGRLQQQQQAGVSAAHHSLAFRVMRLCRPSFQAKDALHHLDPSDLFAGEDLFTNSATISPSNSSSIPPPPRCHRRAAGFHFPPPLPPPKPYGRPASLWPPHSPSVLWVGCLGLPCRFTISITRFSETFKKR